MSLVNPRAINIGLVNQVGIGTGNVLAYRVDDVGNTDDFERIGRNEIGRKD